MSDEYDDLSRFGAMADAVRSRVEQAYLWGVREGMRVQAESLKEPVLGDCLSPICFGLKISRPVNEEMEEIF